VTTAEPPPSGSEFEADLRALGFDITAKGKAKWRKRLQEFDAEWTPEKWAALRRRLGLPERPA
jgi:hypothetical protein